MIKVGDITTTVTKKDYPETIEIYEILPCGTKVKCLVSDTSLEYHDEQVYDLSELRHLSAKELARDIFLYYDIEEATHPFFSKANIEWIKSEAQNYRDLREEVFKECNEEGIDIEDLPSSELYEFDQAAEIAAWLDTLVEIIEREIKEVMEENPT